MRKSCLLTLSAIVLSSGMFAQTLLKNDGAMLVVEPGATLVIEGGVENINGGTINNDGTMEIQGNFLNSANWDSVGANTVIFSGTGAANVTSGGAVFQNVQMNKTAQNITLLDNMVVKGILTFQADNNKIVVGANNLTVRDAGSIASADANEYVVTGGAGYLRKEGLGASETFTFPVGFNSTTYNPVIVAGNVGHTSDRFSVRARLNVQEDGLAGAVLDEGVADVSWEINEAVAGGSNVNLTLQWALGDELMNFDRTMSAVSKHNGTGWNMLFADLGAAGGANPYTRIKNNVTGFTSPSVFAVGSDKQLARALDADLMAFLEGPYVSGTNTQNDGLRVSGLVPLTEEYTDAPIGYTFEGFGGGETTTVGAMNPGGTADDAVDWIVVELRDAGDNTNVVASRAALLQRDGDIVNEDGTMLQIYGIPEGPYFVALRFRNHLGVMTASTVTFASLGVFDFTTAAPAALYGTLEVKQALDGKNVLITGDALRNGLLNNVDLNTIAPESAIGVSNIYSLLDTNMDGLINNSDLILAAPNAAIGFTEQVPN